MDISWNIVILKLKIYENYKNYLNYKLELHIIKSGLLLNYIFWTHGLRIILNIS